MSEAQEELPPHGNQEARNAKARREMSRACGVALVEVTSALAEGAEIDETVSPLDLVLLAFAARARRLLRSAYRLLDLGERAEAAPLMRVMHEQLIVSRWLLLDPEKHLVMWARDDIRRRDVIRERVLADEDVGEEVKVAIAEEAERERAKVRGLVEDVPGTEDSDSRADGAEEETKHSGTEASLDVCPTCGRPPKKKRADAVPSIEQMAAQIGLTFAYNLAYRLQSQADVHATALVVDNTLLKREKGRIQIRHEPDFSLSAFDSYQIAAHFYLDLIRPLAERFPALDWQATLKAVEEALLAIRKADPGYVARDE